MRPLGTSKQRNKDINVDIKGMCAKEKKKREEKKNTDTTDREMSP